MNFINFQSVLNYPYYTVTPKKVMNALSPETVSVHNLFTYNIYAFVIYHFLPFCKWFLINLKFL